MKDTGNENIFSLRIQKDLNVKMFKHYFTKFLPKVATELSANIRILGIFINFISHMFSFETFVFIHVQKQLGENRHVLGVKFN